MTGNIMTQPQSSGGKSPTQVVEPMCSCFGVIWRAPHCFQPQVHVGNCTYELIIDFKAAMHVESYISTTILPITSNKRRIPRLEFEIPRGTLGYICKDAHRSSLNDRNQMNNTDFN